MPIKTTVIKTSEAYKASMAEALMKGKSQSRVITSFFLKTAREAFRSRHPGLINFVSSYFMDVEMLEDHLEECAACRLHLEILAFRIKDVCSRS